MRKMVSVGRKSKAVVVFVNFESSQTSFFAELFQKFDL
jgi:hypothetical protein